MTHEEAGYWLVTLDGLDRTVKGQHAPGDGTPWLCPFPWHETRAQHFRLAEEAEEAQAQVASEAPPASQIIAWLEADAGLCVEVLEGLTATVDHDASPKEEDLKEKEKSPGDEAEREVRLNFTWASLRALDHKKARDLFTDETGQEVDGWGWDALEAAFTAWEAQQVQADIDAGGRGL